MTETAAASVAPIEFVCTETDLVQALRLSQSRSLMGRRSVIRLAAISLVLAVMPFTIRHGLDSDNLQISIILIAVYFALFFTRILWARFISLPRLAHTEFSQRKSLREMTSVVINDSNICFNYDHGTSNIPFDEFHKWSDNKDLILIYHSDRLFNHIPKRAINENFLQSLVAGLSKAGVPRTGFLTS